MSDIKRYLFCENCTSNKIARERRPNGNDKCNECGHVWSSRESVYYIAESDHAKAIEAKDREIENLKSHIKQLETGFDKQTKEIEELKAKAFKAAAALGKIKLEKLQR